MAATDRFYRNQKTLDVIFAVSCIAMLLSVLWMFVQDYNREYKAVQRQFRDVETAMNEHLMLEKLPDVKVVDEKRAIVKARKDALDAKKKELADTEKDIIARRDIQDEKTRNLKAEFDSKSSLYVIEVEHLDKAEDEDQKRSLQKSVQAKKQELDSLEQQLAGAQRELNRINKELKEKVTDLLSPLEELLGEAEDDLKKITGVFDRYAKAAAQKRWKFGDTFRQWPIMDAFSSPITIQQITLPDLTIDYGGFKDVPRYDRCISCHLGIEKGSYDREALERLTQSPRALREEIGKATARLHDLDEAYQSDAVKAETAKVHSQIAKLNQRLEAANKLEEKLRTTREMFKKRASTDEEKKKLGFDPDDLPDRVRYVKLTKGQITQFAAHPRLDLFVDSNSPHAAEKFGCTTCHAGQGSATDFLLAAHYPSTSEQMEEWKKNYDWHSTHDWEFPMWSSRFTEATCLKCHHQVTDLIRYGNKEEAPKLLRGYNLIKENGCFGCHEIAGVKSGRWVGPDLRTEPAPAVEYLSASEQEKLKSDPLSPPGALRKVGPSLRRIAEKTNEEWTRKWITAPRDFRPDTKMPHFYGLSTNNVEALPEDQKRFPATEIDAITHYLFAESKGALGQGPKTHITPQGDDSYRSLLMSELENLELLLARGPLTDRDYKKLQDATRKLADLALLSVPARAADVNEILTDLRRVQDTIKDLNKKKQDQEPQRTKLQGQLAELDKKLADLNKEMNQVEAKQKASRDEDEKAKLDDRMQAISDEQSKINTERGPIKKQLDALAAINSQLEELHGPEPTARQKALEKKLEGLKKEEKELLKASGEKDERTTRLQANRAEQRTVEEEMDRKFGGDLGRYTYGSKNRKGLFELARITPIEKKIFDYRGNVVKVPKAAEGDAKKQKEENGRKLFTERGCLACHQHQGTTMGKAAKLLVDGNATFAPDLSRVALKLAPAIGGKEGARRWLIQWILDPTRYHPRTRMPVTHLEEQEAADVADWLLSDDLRKEIKWKGPEVEEPTHDELIALARVYLAKAPGMTRDDVDAILPAVTKEASGLTQEEMDRRRLPPDSDERRLRPRPDTKQVADSDLKWYIGRKAITRMGCFGCHDVPGFETAKPIGTALNDWGKKDPERLAFEEADVYVKDSHNIVDARDDGQDRHKPAPDWHSKDGKRPYERIFFEALEHHQREGFLHQKLMEPRSYDYNRIRAWDDRLRMPQFKFARGLKRHADENDQQFAARQEQAEAEAREAVMTFVLGLVADPVPLKYVNNPGPERLAEARGRQVLDKFNCAGCHVVHPGMYDFKQTPELLASLHTTYAEVEPKLKNDYSFPGHNAWEGPAPTPERLRLFATYPAIEQDSKSKRDLLSLRLAEALRFKGSDGLVRNLPAAETVKLPPEAILSHTDTQGGAFTELLVPYLIRSGNQDLNDPNKARSALPPPLNREGERVQPKWLYGFLLDPPPLRAQEYMKLRMPKFNMSPDEARALVDYFGASAKTRNPGAGITFPFLTVPQQEDRFWRNRTADYIARLSKDKKLMEKHLEAMQPIWTEHRKKQLVGAEASLEPTKQALEAARKENNKDLIKIRESELEELQKNIKQWKSELEGKKFTSLDQRWENEDAYASDAARLLINNSGSVCLTCHHIGNIRRPGAKGPNLELAAERLRPEWVEMWIANPKRMFTYDTIMPVNFPRDSKDATNKKFFDGDAEQDVKAVRDVLMNLPRLADELPGNQALRSSGAGGGK